MRRLLQIVIAFVRALLSLPHLFRRAEPLSWSDAPKPGRLVDVNGVRVHFVEQGSGPPVVMVHGFGGHTCSFRYLLPELAKRHRVVALDLLGFGYTERTADGDYSMMGQARLVLGLMDALGIERASLLGHSLGGEVVMRVAAMAPQRVEKLILAASVSGYRIPTLPPVLLKPLSPLLARIAGRSVFKRLFYDPSLATDEVREAYLAPARIRGHLDGLYRVIEQMRRDRPIASQDIRAPVLILWPEAERILPARSLRRLRKRFPRAPVIIIERAGHLLLGERPEECLAAIREFLHDAGGEQDVAGPAGALSSPADEDYRTSMST